MSLTLFPTAFPPSNTAVTDTQGRMTNAGMAFWRALFNRTGQDNGSQFTTANGLIGAGTTQADALALTNDWNAIVTGGGGVILPALTTGQQVLVFNNSISAVNVYPPLGASLTVLGVNPGPNLPYAMAVPDAIICYYFSPTDIQAV